MKVEPRLPSNQTTTNVDLFIDPNYVSSFLEPLFNGPVCIDMTTGFEWKSKVEPGVIIYSIQWVGDLSTVMASIDLGAAIGYASEYGPTGMLAYQGLVRGLIAEGILNR